MKKIILSLLTLTSMSAYTQIEDFSLPQVCRLKCDSKFLYGKYKNGALTKESGKYGFSLSFFYYSNDPDIQPGTYRSDDPRIGKALLENTRLCGIYLNVLTENGDYIERLVPDEVYTNKDSDAEDLGEDFKIDARDEGGYLYSGFLNKKPTFMTNETFEKHKTERLKKLKSEGVCK